ncbi:hypothetical protein [Halodurantibacterium flavum]|uniref:DUF2059 domain-containing protein n=1 Tax=Halodurantibacterium flavum TaxID=1382802 RepID=A0ABW4S5M0_9RHOB
MSFLRPVAVAMVLASGMASGMAHAQEDRQAEVQELAALLRLPELTVILREEGLGHGAEIGAEWFPPQVAARWEDAVSEIYDVARMESRIMDRFTAELDASPLVPDMTAFFASDMGRQVVELEVSARQAMLDTDVEAESRDRAQLMWDDGGPRIELIDRFVAAGDLVEANVEGALNANLAFYMGLADGGAFDQALTEQDMLADVWSQEEVIRAETEEWLYAFLILAYGPLPDEALEDYVTFAESAAGRRMTRALFAAFDDVFLAISRDLGIAAARVLAAQDI